jgi:hypothetical protein
MLVATYLSGSPLKAWLAFPDGTIDSKIPPDPVLRLSSGAMTNQIVQSVAIGLLNLEAKHPVLIGSDWGISHLVVLLLYRIRPPCWVEIISWVHQDRMPVDTVRAHDGDFMVASVPAGK